MAKVILFDFWGTLVENGVWSPIKQVRNILRLRMSFPEYVVRMEKAMMTSSYESLRDAFESVAAEFELTPLESTYEELIGMWNKSWMLAKPYPEMEQTLRALKKDHKLVLVSNTDCFSIEKVLEKFGLAELFDQIFLSCKVGKIKTDPEFLQKVLKEIGAEPAECVLVGDSIQSDMKAAEKSGIKGVLIDRRGTRDFDPKIKKLDEILQHL